MEVKTLYTIGYQGRSVDQVINLLLKSGIRTLIDVRYKPTSRKPGLSKSGLKKACEESDIEYFHERDLGTPPEMMDHVRSGAGYDDNIFAEYRKYLLSKEKSLQTVLRHLEEDLACLLCYEEDANNCHRKVVAEELAGRIGLTVQHL
ncbi:DUF488 domain-containing protein [Acidobacteria bacterium AH-259-D05]|nr:DUF488 domain-containing protein [Acidobacteria bacterium AH-259-D05]